VLPPPAIRPGPVAPAPSRCSPSNRPGLSVPSLLPACVACGPAASRGDELVGGHPPGRPPASPPCPTGAAFPSRTCKPWPCSGLPCGPGTPDAVTREVARDPGFSLTGGEAGLSINHENSASDELGGVLRSALWAASCRETALGVETAGPWFRRDGPTSAAPVIRLRSGWEATSWQHCGGIAKSGR
jgi:hypothetical protein